MGIESVINGGISFAAVLVLMVLNIPIGIAMLVAWFFFMIRFYFMPWVLGYSVMGMLSFPLESEISRQIYQFFN